MMYLLCLLALSGGACYMSQGQVNPLGLQSVQESPLDTVRSENMVLGSKLSTNIMKNSSGGYYQNRIRREQHNNIVHPETFVNENDKHQEIVKMVSITMHW